MEITVVVCSVGRPTELARSLSAARDQRRRPDRMVVVAQDSDRATIDVARSYGAEVAQVRAGGLALAIETGISHVGRGIAAFVDDDAVAASDWLERIEDEFRDDSVGAVGGRDNVHGDRETVRNGEPVGVLTGTGRIYGNHHLGAGGARDVHTLKGANMAVRVAGALGVPLSRLVEGEGAQYRNELILTAAIRRRGYRVVYDPRIQVDHFPARRSDGDERTLLTRARIRLNIRNELTGIAISEPPVQVAVFALRTVLVGTKIHPGVVQALLLRLQGHHYAFDRLAGVWAGLRDFLAGRRSRAALIDVIDRLDAAHE